MSVSQQPAASSSGSWTKAARVIVVGSVMFSFISYWRTAAVVLCDLGSTAYYIGGIVEEAVGAAAPWFILAVMLFSYAVRSVYIESCSLFIRGGVYRVVREALGRFFAKLAVSALIFDYLLTGPISGVSAGQYLVGLGLDSLKFINESWTVTDPATRELIKNWGAVVFAAGITIYFFRLNVVGIHESSDRALKIMFATTIMVVLMLAWCGATLAINGIAKNDAGQTNAVLVPPDFSPRPDTTDPITGKVKPGLDPLGTLPAPIAENLRPGKIDWWSLMGVLGLLVAFGHSILAMSGEETLAQVYREVESPKLKNFRKAAFIVFVYSLVFTAGISFLAVLLIPEQLRIGEYKDNLISGLAMNVIGPEWLRLCLNAFVVIVGFLILAGAVNTAIIGSNGVLNRVAEDGIMPEWFLKPHARYGTTHRVLSLIVGLQLIVILLSQGDVILLGEAYAFGVVWSFVFQALAMVVLRFKDPRPREYKVPFNLKIGGVEIPFGLLCVLFTLLSAALLNLFTKELATIAGTVFTAAFFTIFLVSEKLHDRKLKGHAHKHLEQFNQQSTETISLADLGLTKPYRKLVAIRSTQNLLMLEKALADTDPRHTDVVVMTAKSGSEGEVLTVRGNLDAYDQELMTAVVQRAEKAGKHVVPLIVPTNNPLHALLKTAKELKVQELVVGASNKYTADEQLDQISFYWIRSATCNSIWAAATASRAWANAALAPSPTSAPPASASAACSWRSTTRRTPSISSKMC
jgi:amino acid transporter